MVTAPVLGLAPDGQAIPTPSLPWSPSGGGATRQRRGRSSRRCRRSSALKSAESSIFVELLDRRYDEALELLSRCPVEILEAGIFYKPTALFAGMTLGLMNEPDRSRPAYERSREILEAKLSEDETDHRVHAALGLTYAEALINGKRRSRHARRAVDLYPISRDALQAPALHIDLALVHTMIWAIRRRLSTSSKGCCRSLPSSPFPG